MSKDSEQEELLKDAWVESQRYADGEGTKGEEFFRATIASYTAHKVLEARIETLQDQQQTNYEAKRSRLIVELIHELAEMDRAQLSKLMEGKI